MPLIDVSELLVDPDFADTITIYRMVQSVNEFGEASVSPWSFPIIAVVTQAGGKELNRLPEGERQTGAITIHSQTALSTGDASNDADEIGWNGKRYIVKATDDWSTFGAGFTAAICVLKPLNP